MAKKESSKTLFEVAEVHRKAGRAALADAVAKRATDLLTAELKVKGMKFEAKHLGSDWWEQVKLMYPITVTEDGKFKIISEARDWLGEKTWEFDDKYLAIEYIERLIQWKSADRKAGHGDYDADIERALSLQAKREAQTA